MAVAVGLWAAGVLLFALAARWLGPHSNFSATLGSALYSDFRVPGEAAAVMAVIALAVLAPHLRSRRFAQWERRFAQFAIRRKKAVLTAAILPVITRLALLPALPIPQPLQPDEFGYLLLADTFASGRITNPTHPLWRYFETLYVFHQPTYTSLYPIVPGLLLAVPIALRAHPWFGVCASAGLMCAALTWMLQAWLPPKWALLGALIAAARFSIATYWINSYWGGASGAIGGALLLGALPRLIRQARVRDALLAALGVAILSQSRPFEGALLTVLIAALLLYRLTRDFS
ncbi:MAG: hypothetical protein JO336_25045, partial [Acidobacteriia bacterium]|nr:hypothetical protein [Terriglobia bacterium]